MLRTHRYDAMAYSYTGPALPWRTMMCSTAGLQVCLDSGEPERVATRWQALQDLGPLLLATFANSAVDTGPYRGWASARMAAWLGMDPMRTAPPHVEDPAHTWARYAVAAPVLCVRDLTPDSWRAPPGVTFADWLAGAIPRPPTVADLAMHLSTLFPPVRPRGYFEVRYLDTQPADRWFLPVAMLTALFADESTVDRVRELCAPVASAWQPAAQYGLADQAVHRAATQVLDLACRELHRTDLTGPQRDEVVEGLSRRLTDVPGDKP
jgi:glutamate--cysteine ligase